MSAAVLQITDGTTTVDLTGGDYIILNDGGWAPQRAEARTSLLAGFSPYKDVLETMYLRITGTSTSDCLANLKALSDLLYQADRWSRGEKVTAVEIQYKPTGSSLASAVTANILGQPEGGFLRLPTSFDKVDNMYSLGSNYNPIVLQFYRRGLWLGTTETKVASIETSNPAIMSVAAYTNNHKVHVPHDVRFFVNRTSGISYHDILALISNESDKLYCKETEDLTLTYGGVATIAKTVYAGASNGYYTQCTVTSSPTDAAIMTDTSPGIDSAYGRVAWWVTVQNSTGSDILLTLLAYGTGQASPEYLNTIVPASPSGAQLVFLGISDVVAPLAKVALWVRMNGSGGGTVNVDVLMGLVMDDNAHIITMQDCNYQSVDTYYHFNHRLDGYLGPEVFETNNGTTKTSYPPYDGNPAVFLTGNGLSAILWGKSPSVSNEWKINTALAGTTDASITLSAVRTEGYLTPV